MESERHNGVAENKKEESETSYASSSLIFPDLGNSIKAFEKNLEGLENLVKLFKSDVSKMFDISDSSSSINASPEK